MIRSKKERGKPIQTSDENGFVFAPLCSITIEDSDIYDMPFEIKDSDRLKFLEKLYSIPELKDAFHLEAEVSTKNMMKNFYISYDNANKSFKDWDKSTPYFINKETRKAPVEKIMPADPIIQGKLNSLRQ